MTLSPSPSAAVAAAFDGLPRSETRLPHGSVAGGAAIPSSRVPENLIHILEKARGTLDHNDFDTVNAEMSIHWHAETGAATLYFLLPPQTGAKK